MTLKGFSDCIEFNIQHNIMHAVLGIGAPGMGKSQLIQQIGKKYGYKVIDLRLAQMSEVEIGGLMYPNKEEKTTEWLRPNWFPLRDYNSEEGLEVGGGKTLLLLDEITSAQKRVQVAAYQLVLDRRVGKHILPSNTVIIALGNGEDDGGVFEGLAAPLANRFEIYNVTMEPRVWLNYAKNKIDKKTGRRFNSLVTSYIESHPNHLHTQSENEDEIVFASPRTWERLSDTLNTGDIFSADGRINSVVQHKIFACVGFDVGHQFVNYISTFANNTTAFDVLTGKKPEVPQDINTQLYVMDSCISIYSAAVKSGDYSDDELVQFHANLTEFASGYKSEYQTAFIQSIDAVDMAITGKSIQKNGLGGFDTTIKQIYGMDEKDTVYDSMNANKSNVFTDDFSDATII